MALGLLLIFYVGISVISIGGLLGLYLVKGEKVKGNILGNGAIIEFDIENKKNYEVTETGKRKSDHSSESPARDLRLF